MSKKDILAKVEAAANNAVSQDFAKKNPETFEIYGNNATVSLPRTRICTLDQLIEHCQIDLSVWEVERFVANKWEVGAKNADGNLVVEPLFQVKAFLRRKVAIVSAQKEIQALKDLAKAGGPKAPVTKSTRPPSGNMLELNIPDLHAGKLAWEVETGENYDIKLAEQVHGEAVDALLTRVSPYTFDEIVYVVGNDLFNSDDVEGQTTKGTHVSTDSRYHKTFGVVRNMVIATIETLRAKAKRVKVILIPGNHDTLTVWHLGDSLECYFHKYSDVEIDNIPRNRKYHQFGLVMLGFTHGDKGKRQDYPLIMATEQPAMFGSTKFREMHCGHNHMTKLDEQHGVRVRVLPALTATDDWHFENGFVGNMRSAEAHIWNANEGLLGTAIFTKVGK